MEGTYIDCGRNVTDSPFGRNVTTLNHDTTSPKVKDYYQETKQQ